MTEAKITYDALAAYEAKGQLKPFQYTPLPLGAHDVEIAIHACGG
jgi:D-arabinose 1-dehydrogenase-like Zn-dependent alcohol dehydrogenase